MGMPLFCIPKLPISPGGRGWGVGGCSLLGLLNRQLRGEGQPCNRDEPARDVWCMCEVERQDPNWVLN